MIGAVSIRIKRCLALGVAFVLVAGGSLSAEARRFPMGGFPASGFGMASHGSRMLGVPSGWGASRGAWQGLGRSCCPTYHPYGNYHSAFARRGFAGSRWAGSPMPTTMSVNPGFSAVPHWNRQAAWWNPHPGGWVPGNIPSNGAPYMPGGVTANVGNALYANVSPNSGVLARVGNAISAQVSPSGVYANAGNGIGAQVSPSGVYANAGGGVSAKVSPLGVYANTGGTQASVTPFGVNVQSSGNYYTPGYNPVSRGVIRSVFNSLLGP